MSEQGKKQLNRIESEYKRLEELMKKSKQEQQNLKRDFDTVIAELSAIAEEINKLENETERMNFYKELFAMRDVISAEIKTAIIVLKTTKASTRDKTVNRIKNSLKHS